MVFVVLFYAGFLVWFWCFGVFVLCGLLGCVGWLFNCALVGVLLAENWICMAVVSVVACCRLDGCLIVCLLVRSWLRIGFVWLWCLLWRAVVWMIV